MNSLNNDERGKQLTLKSPTIETVSSSYIADASARNDSKHLSWMIKLYLVGNNNTGKSNV